jgi:hypothetical protein
MQLPGATQFGKAQRNSDMGAASQNCVPAWQNEQLTIVPAREMYRETNCPIGLTGRDGFA